MRNPWLNEMLSWIKGMGMVDKEIMNNVKKKQREGLSMKGFFSLFFLYNKKRR